MTLLQKYEDVNKDGKQQFKMVHISKGREKENAIREEYTRSVI